MRLLVFPIYLKSTSISTTMSEPDNSRLSDTSSTQSDPRSESYWSDDAAELSLHDEDRPRWSRNAHKWRRLTHDERLLAAGLDQIEADELSIHLYNVHSLKRRVYKQDAENTTKRWESKRHWVEPGEWVPRKSWTAWPLKPEVVPRDGEKFGKVPEDDEDEAWTAKSTQRIGWKPSGVMEEVVMAEILRTAREEYDRREWEDDSESDEMVRVKKKQKLRVHGKSRTIARNEDMILDAKSECTTSIGKDGGSIRGANQALADHSKLDAVIDKDEDTDCEKDDRRSTPSLRPVILADDDEAHKILQPSIRNILQRINDLLMGLHHSRQNCLDADASDKISDTETPTSEEELLASRQERSRVSAASGHTRPVPFTRPRSKTRPSKEYLLRYIRPRDWSEVLGIAAMTGWSSEVVQRAATRCADLFGESMTFASLQESPPGFPSRKYQGADRTVVAPLNEGTDADGTSGTSFSAHPSLLNPWRCPEQSCSKHTKAFAHRWGLVRHVLRVHGYEYEDSTATQLQTLQTQPEVTLHPKSLSCPFGNCRSRNKIFAKHWRLLEHLRRTHGWVKPPTSDQKTIDRARSTSSVSDSGSGSGSASESDAGSGVSGGEMYGGVHIDGFLQPIRKRTEWKIPRSRSEDNLAKAKRNKRRKRTRGERTAT